MACINNIIISRTGANHGTESFTRRARVSVTKDGLPKELITKTRQILGDYLPILPVVPCDLAVEGRYYNSGDYRSVFMMRPRTRDFSCFSSVKCSLRSDYLISSSFELIQERLDFLFKQNCRISYLFNLIAEIFDCYRKSPFNRNIFSQVLVTYDYSNIKSTK